MRHIVPIILLGTAIFGLILGITATILAFLISGNTVLFYPAVMITVLAAVVNVSTIVPSITLKSKICNVAAVISGVSLALVVISFIVLATV